MSNKVTIPEIKESCYVAWESTGLLDEKECALCSKAFESNPAAKEFDSNSAAHGLAAVTLTCKDRRSDQRMYFPFYHLVCKKCYKFLNEEDEEEDEEEETPKKILTESIAARVTIPWWSKIEEYISHREFRPSGLVALDDPDSVFDLLDKMYDETHTWEDFNYISFGAYEDLLPSDTETIDDNNYIDDEDS